MSEPELAHIERLIDASWPAASVQQSGPWIIREGRGGGNRVSAATPSDPVSGADIDIAEDAMGRLNQLPLFRVRSDDIALDDLLANRGYHRKDVTNIYAAPVEALATEKPPPVSTFEVEKPLQIMQDIWLTDNIGPARLAVMNRVAIPKINILGRICDKPAAAAFVASNKSTAMLHGLVVLDSFRQQGLAINVMRAAAFWAQKTGATHFTLLATQANTAANALYSKLGMTIMGQYHYRIQHKRERA